jgi:hypothetical protein
MRATAQLHVLNRRCTSIGKRHDVVILEKTTFSATPRGTDERATTVIPFPDGAFDSCWNVATVWLMARLSLRAMNRRVLCPLQLGEQ